MEDFSVIPYTKDHLGDVMNLWKEQFPQDYVPKREILFNWLTQENPFLNGHSPYFLLLHGGKVIGMHGHMPLMFSINGIKKLGFIGHDDLVAVAYRGKGLGKVMLQGVGAVTESFSGSLWHNEPNYNLYLKSGWLDVPNFYLFVKIFDPKVFLEKKFKSEVVVEGLSSLGRGVLRLKDIRLHFRSLENIQISEIERFDKQYDAFFDETSSSLPVVVLRNHRYLNWQYVDKPFNSYKRFAALDQKRELAGYMVIKKEQDETTIQGKIIDIFVHPGKPEVFEALIRKSIEEFTKMKASHIVVINSHSRFITLLCNLGFVRAKSPQHFLLLNWQNHFQRAFARDIHNWYLTCSDADGDAWSVDS